MDKIAASDFCCIELISSVYETKPFGGVVQANFLNIVIKMSSGKDAVQLLGFLKSVEVETGRTKSVKWGPREIDIDLLYFNDLIYSDETTTIPHKGIPFRDFVAVPLDEIAPGFVHPALKKKNSDICKEVPESYIIRKFPGELKIKKG